MKKPYVLMVLDGWGIAPPDSVNAITAAPDEAFSLLRKTYLSTSVKAHGNAVGLMPDQMGDSNVGHLTIGSGRIIHQNLPRIFEAIQSEEIFQNTQLVQFFQKAKGHRLHLMGLLSPGGVHSHQVHLRALLEACRRFEVDQVFLHLWMDGRDVSPKSGMTSLEYLANAIGESGIGRVATIGGRYYAMDRDTRWERTEKSYRAMVEGKGPAFRSAPEALRAAYADDKTDEFVVPSVIVDDTGTPVGRIEEEDFVCVFNFRADRVRQMTRALADPKFSHFSRPFRQVQGFLGMTEYDEAFALPYVFGPQTVHNTLSEWLDKQGLTQLHVAETEKYAHVTFFFNGGSERQYDGEKRVLIPSPKVATYDLQPEMSAYQVADVVVEDIQHHGHDFILLNFANSDMVGHSGQMEATQKAVRVVDSQIQRIADAVLAVDGVLLIVADHGNAEVMQDENGQPHTNHTTNPVPFVVIAGHDVCDHHRLHSDGGLQDIAPTILDMMGIAMPKEMTGRSLYIKES